MTSRTSLDLGIAALFLAAAICLVLTARAVAKARPRALTAEQPGVWYAFASVLLLFTAIKIVNAFVTLQDLFRSSLYDQGLYTGRRPLQLAATWLLLFAAIAAAALLKDQTYTMKKNRPILLCIGVIALLALLRLISLHAVDAAFQLIPNSRYLLEIFLAGAVIAFTISRLRKLASRMNRSVPATSGG